MKISIYDVAKKAGVSISTASKALNDRKDVGESTKERIRSIARELNYEPSHFARALAMRKTDNIGVLTVRYFPAPVITNPFYSKIIEGIEECLIRENLNLVTNILRKEQVEGLETPKMVKEKAVDGIILLGHMPEGFVKEIIGRGLPAVMVDNKSFDGSVSTVMIDNEGGAYNAVTRLINTGHKRIAYLSGPSSRESFKKRREGYSKALSDKGLSPDGRFVVFNETGEPGYSWMKKILSHDEKPDAVFACNDVTAILAVNMLKEAGFRVPRDISVVGFDNIDMGTHFIPAIATVDVNKEMMGVKSAEKLLELINNKNAGPGEMIFPTRFISRDSLKER